MRRIFFATVLFLSLAVSVGSQQSVNLFYVATTVDAFGTESANSNEASALVTPAHNVVDLSWTASVTPNIAGYNMYRSKVSGGPYTKINSTLISGTTFTDTFSFPAAPTTLKTVVP